MTTPEISHPRHRANAGLALLFALPLLLWVAPAVATLLDSIDLAGVERPYLVIGGFVVFDAVIPIFPSESLLTSASNLAAQPDSDIVLMQLILAGTVGAIVGDTLLYWLARTSLRSTMSERVEQIQSNPKVARGMAVVDDSAEMLIVFGRFVPGLRFVIGASMGLTRYPYRRFLAYDVLGGSLWATYTCVFSYLVATVIEDKPIVSIAVSVVVTTALLGVLYVPIARSFAATRHPESTEAP